MDALALGAEEGRGNLRKAMVSRKQAMTHGCPNGGTHLGKTQVSITEHIGYGGETRGTETSKYPEEKKENSISQVAASEREGAQTNARNRIGVEDRRRVYGRLVELSGKAGQRR